MRSLEQPVKLAFQSDRLPLLTNASSDISFQFVRPFKMKGFEQLTFG